MIVCGQTDAKRALIGRMLLRAFAVRHLGCDAATLQFERTNYGRPILSRNSRTAVTAAAALVTTVAVAATATAATATAPVATAPRSEWRSAAFVDFNVSHHGAWVVLSAAADTMVGADVMSVEVSGGGGV